MSAQIEPPDLKEEVEKCLSDHKGFNIVCLPVAQMSDVTDQLIIVSGQSDRHVQTLARYVVALAKEKKHSPIGVEGLEHGEWVLVDLGDIHVHIMQVRIRDYYNLEKLWAPGIRDLKSIAEAYREERHQEK